MSANLIIIDCIDEINELSAVINSYDETGDMDPYEIIRMCAVAAALAFDKSKVNQKDQVSKDNDLSLQISRIKDKLSEFDLNEDNFNTIITAVTFFVTELADKLILVIKDQTRVATFNKVRDDMSLLFNVLDNKDGKTNEDTGGVSNPT